MVNSTLLAAHVGENMSGAGANGGQVWQLRQTHVSGPSLVPPARVMNGK